MLSLARNFFGGSGDKCYDTHTARLPPHIGHEPHRNILEIMLALPLSALPEPGTPAPLFRQVALVFVSAVSLACVLGIGSPLMAADTQATDESENDKSAAGDNSFDGQVAAAWRALAKRDVAGAKTAIAAAKASANDDQKKEAGQLGLLALCIERFWKAVDAELKRVAPGDELEVAGTKVAVVESKDDSLTLHVEGKNKKYSRAALPGRVALALAEHRFDNSPANKVLLGAFLAVDPDGDRRRARKLWQDAGRGEPTAPELLALLEYPNIPPARGGKEHLATDDGSDGAGGDVAADGPAPIPSKEKMTAALKRVKEEFGGDIRGAKTAEQKQELSASLIEKAADGEDDPWRLALLRQAVDLAAAAGNPDAIDTSVAAMEKYFKIDAWEVSAEAFTRADNTAKPQTAAELVRRSLLLLTAWEAQAAAAKAGHAKLAGKLEQAALAAAHKSRDPDLENAVMDRKKSAPADGK